MAKNGGAQATFKNIGLLTRITGCQHFELVPLNDDYPIISSDHQPLTIIGVMIEHRIYRRSANPSPLRIEPAYAGFRHQNKSPFITVRCNPMTKIQFCLLTKIQFYHNKI